MRRPDQGAVLDRRTLGRTLLARQHLLDRVDAPVGSEIEHLVGLQAQVPRDPYVALWSRLRDFDPAGLERLLLERKAVRITLMRTTLHLVTARDASTLRAAFQDVCERGFARSPFRRRLDGIDASAVAAAGSAILEERPRTLAELARELAERWPGRDPEALAYAVRYLVPVVQVTPRGLFRRSTAPRLATLRSWLGTGAGAGADIAAPDADPRLPERAIDEAVERYLVAFGPATAGDIRAWSGLASVREILERLDGRLRSYRDESGRLLVDVADGLFAEADRPAPVRFLGEYDNIFLAHADRSRVTGDAAWGGWYARRGAFFVDGLLAGAWRLREAGDPPRIELEGSRPLAPSERQEVEAEAAALARFLAPEARSHPLAWIG